MDIQEDELLPKITVQETGSDESVGTASQAEVLRERVYRFSITPDSGVTGNLTIGLDHTDLTGLNGREMGEVEPIVVYGRSVVSIEDAEVNESDGVLEFAVKLDEAARVRTTVDWATEDVTASSGRDYEAASGTFTFEAGETRKRGKVVIFRTARAEEDETFSIVLSNALPSNRLVIDPDRGTGTMTIKDDSLGAEFRQPATPRTDDSNFEVPLSFHGVPESFSPTTEAVKKALRIANREDCSGARVAGVSGSSGSGKDFTVEVDPDGECHIELTIDEGTEIAGAVMQYTARIWIRGPGGVSVSITDARATEGDDRIRFTVTLSAPPVETVTVEYATRDLDAMAGNDYTAKSGTLTFDPPRVSQGKPRAVIEVPVRDDTVIEDREKFAVVLTNPSSGLAVSDGTANGTIDDNDQGAEFDLTSPRTNGGNFDVRLDFRLPVFDVDIADFKANVHLSAGLIVDINQYTGGQRFILTIDPPDERHIEIVLPRGAVLGGHTIREEARAWLLGPLSFGIGDAEGTEGTDSELRFAVSLSGTAPAPVSVQYETENGTAEAGSDYTAQRGKLTFAAGETLKYVSVPILDDDVDEDEEQFKVKLKGAQDATISDNEGIGTIKNHDAIPIALIARFGRASASHIVDQIETRIKEPAGRGGVAFDLGGAWKRPAENGIDMLPGGPAGMHAGGGSAGGGRALHQDGMAGLNVNGMSGPVDDDPLDRAGLAVSRQMLGGTMSVWTQGAQSSFTGRQAQMSLNGEVRTRMVGADYARGRIITGASIARSRGTGAYSGVTQGEVTSTVTGLYPWIGYRATDRLTVWGVGGYGAGQMILTTGAGAQRSGMSMAMTAVGARGELGSGAGIDLAVKADALWVGTSIAGGQGPNGNLAAAHATVTRMRTGIEGSRSYTLLGRLAVKPVVEIGLRRDGGDAERGAGIDIGTGLALADAASGLAVDVRIRTLAVHQAEDFSERGVAVTFSYNPTSTPHGLNARFTPAWGANATGSAHTLWGGDTMRGFGYGERERRLDGEVGYGLGVGRFVGAPHIGFSSTSQGRMYRLGYGLRAPNAGALQLELRVDVQRSEGMHQRGATHGTIARARVSW